jgi:hypothetical protein
MQAKPLGCSVRVNLSQISILKPQAHLDAQLTMSFNTFQIANTDFLTTALERGRTCINRITHFSSLLDAFMSLIAPRKAQFLAVSLIIKTIRKMKDYYTTEKNSPNASQLEGEHSAAHFRYSTSWGLNPSIWSVSTVAAITQKDSIGEPGLDMTTEKITTQSGAQLSTLHLSWA